MELRCTSCDHAFEGEREERCPKCLRKTSVVRTDGAALAAGTRALAPWPTGPACPLCLERNVTEATFYFQVATTKPTSDASSPDAGSGEEWITVRLRACDVCPARAAATERLRLLLFPFVTLGLLVWPLALPVDGPLQRLGLGFGGSLAVGVLVSVIVAGIPLYVIDRASRAFKSTLDTSWLFKQVRAAVSTPGVAVVPDRWKVVSRAPKDAKRVLDGEALLMPSPPV